MNRFHVHVAVKDLGESVFFYSKLFGQSPTTERLDYAKWLLDNPRVNFAISARGHAIGVNHFGFQADSAEELHALRALADAASDGQVLDQKEAACCYAKSEKHWTVDPQGFAWEHFHSLAETDQFGADTANQSGACCIPVRGEAQEATAENAACCIPNREGQEGACCG